MRSNYEFRFLSLDCVEGLNDIAHESFFLAHAIDNKESLKELFFFDMLASGIWLARRGMMTLCLPIGDKECDKLAGAVEEFLVARGPLWK